MKKLVVTCSLETATSFYSIKYMIANMATLRTN